MPEPAATPVEGTKQAAPASGNAPQATAAPGLPTWLSEAIGQDEGRRTDFVKAARSTFDEDFAKHKEASAKRERELTGRVSASDWWKGLDEEARERSLDAASLREDAIDTYADRVPKKLLEKFGTAKGVREFARDFIDANGAPKAPEKAGEGDDMETRIAARVAAMMGASPKGTEPIARGTPAAPQTEINADNIDKLYMDAEREGLNPNP